VSVYGAAILVTRIRLSDFQEWHKSKLLETYGIALKGFRTKLANVYNIIKSIYEDLLELRENVSIFSSLFEATSRLQQVCQEWVNNCLILLSTKMITVEDFFEENFKEGPLNDFENAIKGFLVNVHPLFHSISEFGKSCSLKVK
jgi:hypothetical protein